MSQFNIGNVKHLVGNMLEAVNNPLPSINDKVKIISKLKSKIVKKQQNLTFQMKVKADMTPKNAPEGKKYKEYQEMGAENSARFLFFQLIKSKARKVELASIGKDAKANMIKIGEKFREII